MTHMKHKALNLYCLVLTWQVSSIVELVGIIICLQAAAKISHRAQGLASVTSRWHALVTCSSSDATENLESSHPAGSLPISYSETDLESIDYVPVPTNTQLASYMSLYHKREAFGMSVKTTTTAALMQFHLSLSQLVPVILDFVH